MSKMSLHRTTTLLRSWSTALQRTSVRPLNGGARGGVCLHFARTHLPWRRVLPNSKRIEGEHMKTKQGLFLVGIAVIALTALAQTPFLLNPPTFPNTNTLRLTLSDAATNVAFTIYSTPNLDTGIVWSVVTNGSTGQLTFDLSMPTNILRFYQASHPTPPV